MFKHFTLAKQYLLPEQQLESEVGYSQQVLSLLKGLPFYIWNEEKHQEEYIKSNGLCCFNHVVGLPTKDKKELPLFDYEKLLYDTLLSKGDKSFKDKHLWVKKATGLGITEFCLRLMAWLCTSTDDYKDSQMCIIVGPNIDLATKLIKRLKGIFTNKLNLYFSNKETVLELNGCSIQAYPSNHMDSFRSLTNPKFILCDEFDFIESEKEQDDARHVTERYIGKSDPYIVMVSTPNAPLGLFEKIEKEPEETCLYNRIKLDYHYGLGKIYSIEEIEKAKQSPGFQREYGLQYLGKIGNVFSSVQIDRAIELGEQFTLEKIPINNYVLHNIGIDPGFSSSRTAIVVTERLKEQNKIRVIESIEFEKPNPSEIANIIFDLTRKYRNSLVWIDGANAGMVNELKVKFGEEYTSEPIEPDPEQMKILPVNFGTEHKRMLSNLHLFISKEYLCIPSKFDKLIISLRTAWANEYSLDKNQTSYSDSLDALRLALKGFKID